MVEWPIKPTERNAMGDLFDVLIQGWLNKLTGILKHSVIFGHVLPSGKIDIIQEAARDYSSVAPFCDQLRKLKRKSEGKTWEEECCREQDERTVDVLYAHYQQNSSLPSGWKRYREKEISTVCYAYSCKWSTLMEWAIPVVLDHSIIGVFITGQFTSEQFKLKEAQKHVTQNLAEYAVNEDMQSHILEELKAYQGGSHAPLEEDQAKFFHEVEEIHRALQTNYKHFCEQYVNDVERTALRYVNDEAGHYREPFIQVPSRLEHYCHW